MNASETVLATLALAALGAMTWVWWRTFSQPSRTHDGDAGEHGIVILSALWLITFGATISSVSLALGESVGSPVPVLGRILIRGALLTVIVYLVVRTPGWTRRR